MFYMEESQSYIFLFCKKKICKLYSKCSNIYVEPVRIQERDLKKAKTNNEYKNHTMKIM